jgi:lysophospholipase L1-like esterase
VKILFSLVLIVGTSFSLAWVWQTTQQAVVAEVISASQPTETATEPTSEIATAASEAPETEPPTEESAPEEEATDPVDMPGAVPESEPVEQTYFDDAIFFGDSISTGIPLYHVADNAAVVAMTNINTDNINYKEVIDAGDDKRVTMIEAAKEHGERGKVYIMLGGNGMGFDKAVFIDGYRTFLTSVRELYPNAVIYLQGMTPVTADYVNKFDPTLNNAKIDEYNLEILALAEEMDMYYLDVGSALKDENGALPEEASPLDGMHFSPEYYVKWFDYLKTHTVEATA